MSGRAATLDRQTLWADPRAEIAAVVLAGAAIGLALTVAPMLALLPFGALASGVLLVSGRARFVFVIAGGLLIFQREQTLSASKLAFLALFVVAFVGAFVNVRSLRGSLASDVTRPLIHASVAFGALLALSLVVAHNGGIPLGGAWVRDVAPYLLFASAPVFALDAQATFSRRGLVALLVAAGMTGAIFFAVSWLERRGITNLGITNVGLASRFVPAALFAYGMSMTLQTGRTRWIVTSTSVLALLLVTGTRTNLVLLVAPIAVAFGVRHQRAIRSIRLAVLAPIVIAITIGLGLAVIKVTHANEQYLRERIAVFKSTGSASDASYVERRRETAAARAVFDAHRIVGAGPGTTFDWMTIDNKNISSFVPDTPLTFPAKFGLLGLAVLAFVIACYWSFTRSLVRIGKASVENLTLVGYLAVVALSAVTTSPFEDKGFSFGLMLVLALALVGVSERESAAPGPAVAPPR